MVERYLFRREWRVSLQGFNQAIDIRFVIVGVRADAEPARAATDDDAALPELFSQRVGIAARHNEGDDSAAVGGWRELSIVAPAVARRRQAESVISSTRAAIAGWPWRSKNSRLAFRPMKPAMFMVPPS